MVAEQKPSGDGEGRQPSPISPAKRKRLQQAFEAANLQMRQENYDYANELFTQCVLGDPANPVYVQSFLGNLKQKYKNNKKGSNLAFIKGAGSQSMVKKSQVQKDWPGVIKHGVDVLKLNPWHVSTLKAMATACEELEYGESQLHFLKMALEYSPNDAEINRLCAVALRARGQYDQAIACWHRVERTKPGNEEATRAIASLAVEKTIRDANYLGDDAKKLRDKQTDGVELTQEQRLEREIRRNPKELPRYIELAELYIREELFTKAAEVYRRAMQIDQSNVELVERLEDVEIRHLRARLVEAEKQAGQSGRPEDKQQRDKLKREVFETELVHAKNRVERYPSNLQYKFLLAERYKALGHYKEAIAEYQLARNDPKYRGVSVLALGLCFKNIKKYRLAMKHFEEAIEEIADRDAENRKMALYQAGRMAVAMRDLEAGEKYLTTLAGLDFSYKDVAVLLDKIAELRKNTESQGPGGGQGMASSPI